MLNPRPECDFMKKRNKKNRAPLSITAERLRPSMSPDLPPPESYPGRSSHRRFLSGNERFLRFIVKN
jgi:tetrahydromethanopterin S-methyltransferase subunit B